MPEAGEIDLFTTETTSKGIAERGGVRNVQQAINLLQWVLWCPELHAGRHIRGVHLHGESPGRIVQGLFEDPKLADGKRVSRTKRGGKGQQNEVAG